jgi:hypothetical protein
MVPSAWLVASQNPEPAWTPGRRTTVDFEVGNETTVKLASL